MNYFHGIMFLFNIGLAIALIIQYVRFHDIIKVVGKPYGATVFQIRDAFAEILFKRASEEFRYRMGKEANHHVMKLAEQ